MTPAAPTPTPLPTLSQHVHAPRWRLIQQELESDIRSGRLAVGEKLPSEEVLAKRFLAHRHTVRRALGRLQEKGIVRTEQGRGTFVREPVLSHTHGTTSRLAETAAGAGTRAERRFLTARRIGADKIVARALRQRVDEPVMMIETLRTLRDVPIALTTHYFPLPRFEGIDGLLAENGSISAAYRHCGVTEFAHLEARVTAEAARRRDADLLDQPISRPVLRVSNLSVDGTGTPIQLAISRYAAGRFELRIDHFHDR